MLIWSYWPGHEGGAERQCRKLVRQLERKGIESVVITSLHSYRMPRKSWDGDTLVLRFGVFCPVAVIMDRMVQAIAGAMGVTNAPFFQAISFWVCLPIQWLARLSFFLELFFGLRYNRLGVDILHVHESSWLAGLGVWLAEKWRVPVICKVRSTPAFDVIGYDVPLRRYWKKLRLKAEYIALYNALRDELIKYGIPMSKISVIPNGVNIPKISDLEQRSNEVLYVGNFSQVARWKAFDVLIDAWERVAKEISSAHLTLLGGGNSEIWKNRARDGGFSASLVFAGHTWNPEAFYRKAGVFVLPSRIEGMSNALLEAQSWGIASVVSDIPGNCAVVEHEVNGLLVPVGDAEALSLALIRLLRDPELRQKLGKNARRRIIEFFDAGCVADRIVALYTRLHANFVSQQFWLQEHNR
jgi:glycosyltransferase involved in cell wall biosynthesis